MPLGLLVTVPLPDFVTVRRGVPPDVTVTCIVAVFWDGDESLTVMVAVPAKTPLAVNVVPEIVAVAMFVAEDVAVCAPVPPEIWDVVAAPTAIVIEEGPVRPPLVPPAEESKKLYSPVWGFRTRVPSSNTISDQY